MLLFLFPFFVFWTNGNVAEIIFKKIPKNGSVWKKIILHIFATRWRSVSVGRRQLGSGKCSSRFQKHAMDVGETTTGLSCKTFCITLHPDGLRTMQWNRKFSTFLRSSLQIGLTKVFYISSYAGLNEQSLWLDHGAL